MFVYWFSFEDTPKAFANLSPGLELATTLGHTRKKNFNAVSVGHIALANAFSVGSVLSLNPGLKQPWATISESLRRIFKLNQYLCSSVFDPLFVRRHNASRDLSSPSRHFPQD